MSGYKGSYFVNNRGIGSHGWLYEYTISDGKSNASRIEHEPLNIDDEYSSTSKMGGDPNVNTRSTFCFTNLAPRAFLNKIMSSIASDPPILEDARFTVYEDGERR